MLSDQLQLLWIVVRRLKWLFIFMFYMAIVAGFKGFGIMFLGALMALSGVAYFKDKEREARGADDFRGDWLFFRYGGEVDRSYFSIPVKPEWSIEQTLSFASSFRKDLARRIAARIPAESSTITEPLTIVDQETGERRDFFRLVVRSKFGSMLTHFVHYSPFGQTITAHYFTFVRGTHSDWDVAKFILAGPCTIWLWGVPWLLNRYSILATISEFRASSFDGIDLVTMYSLTHHLLFVETREILDEAGFLTEEVKQQINFNLNQQNVNISKSSRVSLGSVGQSVLLPQAS